MEVLTSRNRREEDGTVESPLFRERILPVKDEDRPGRESNPQPSEIVVVPFKRPEELCCPREKSTS